MCRAPRSRNQFLAEVVAPCAHALYASAARDTSDEKRRAPLMLEITE